MRRLLWVLILLAIGATLTVYYEDEISDLIHSGRQAAFGPQEEQGTGLAPTVPATLFFASTERDLLAPYETEVDKGKDDVDTLRNVLAALVAGPKREGYAPVIPFGTKLRTVFPGEKGAVYVDFNRTFRTGHPGGAWAELLTAYAVANTVIKNFPESFDQVVLLVDGQEALTVAGTLAITGPLRLREDLVTQASAAAPPAESAPAGPPAETPPAALPAAPETPPAAGVPSAPLPPVGAPPPGGEAAAPPPR